MNMKKLSFTLFGMRLYCTVKHAEHLKDDTLIFDSLPMLKTIILYVFTVFQWQLEKMHINYRRMEMQEQVLIPNVTHYDI